MSTRMIRTAALAFIGAIVASAGSAFANDYRSKATGNWNANTSWQRNDGGTWVDVGEDDPLPTSGDIVTVRSPDVITVSTSGVQVTTLTVDSGGSLVISSGQDLSLAGSSPSATVNGSMTVTGKFVMGVSGATLTIGSGQEVLLDNSAAVLLVTANATISGSGALRGNHDSASIRIGVNPGSAAAITLQNSSNIKGRMVIQRTASSNDLPIFDNRGLVEANVNGGTIELASTLNSIVDTVASSSCGDFRWKVATSGAILTFNKAATGPLLGDFLVGPGTLNINQHVTSSGLFKFMTGGSVAVPAGVNFSITGTGGTGNGNHYCSGSSCTGTAFPYSNQTVNCP